MRRKVEISKTRTEEITYTTVVGFEEYWVLRGIKDTGLKKEVVAELEMESPPTHEDIAQFLIDNIKATFCSVQHNFRLKGE